MGVGVMNSLKKLGSGGVGVCDKGKVEWDNVCNNGAGDGRERSKGTEKGAQREVEGSG